MNPGGVELFGATVNQMMQHGQDLTFHRSEGLGGLHLDQVLVESGHHPCQGKHKIGKRRGHVTHKTWCCGVDRLGHQVFLYELGIVRNVGRLFGDGTGGEAGLDLLQRKFNRHDMSLQKPGNVSGNRTIDGTEG